MGQIHLFFVINTPLHFFFLKVYSESACDEQNNKQKSKRFGFFFSRLQFHKVEENHCKQIHCKSTNRMRVTQHGTQQPPEYVTKCKVCVLHATDPLGVFLPPSYLSARAAFPSDVEGKHSLSNKKVFLGISKGSHSFFVIFV